MRGLFLNEGKQDLPLPDGMPPDMLAKRFFAKQYGWTEAQAENASLDALKWFPLIEEAESVAAEKRARAESSRAQSRSR